MSRILEAAVEIERFFRARKWRFCVIGGLAAMRWCPPRVTEDVDFSLLVELGDERPVIDRILRDFTPRGDDAGVFALESRVLLVKASNGTDIDIALAAFPFEEEIIRRATKFTYEKGVRLTTASAEDMVLLKAIAARPRDWQDVGDIVPACGTQFEWAYLDRQLAHLREAFDVEDIRQRLDPLRPPPARPSPGRRKRPRK